MSEPTLELESDVSSDRPDRDGARTCDYVFDPGDHDRTSLESAWSCPHDSLDGGDRCPFHVDEAERAARDLEPDDVRDALRDVLERGDPAERTFVGADLPELSLDYVDVEGPDQHPIDLRHAVIDGLTATHARFEERLDLRDATLADVDLEDADFEDGLRCSGATFAGSFDMTETVVAGADADFTAATFEGPVHVDQTTFRDDVSFRRARFEGVAAFRGADFRGQGTTLDDARTFDGAEFRGEVSFHHATFGPISFTDATFGRAVTFEAATAESAVDFTDVSFDDDADFDELTCRDDATFEGAEFAAAATFRGAEFEGGADLLHDDVSFAGVTFRSGATFERARLGDASFEAATVRGDVSFEGATFTDDSSFERTTFERVADFDEVRFEGDADFSDAAFRDRAVFRGAEFHGRTNHLEDDARFEGTVFADDANFRNTLFSTANFDAVSFRGDADFTEASFTEDLHLSVTSVREDTYFDFTRARVADGEIIQPAEGWVRYDFTEATVGTVTLSAANPKDRRELLDYFRFCETTFDGFDFSDHTAYLDRNDWNLHTFDRGRVDREPELELTPERIEQTYLQAKTTASAQGNVKAAGEFRVKRQQYARETFRSIVADSSESTAARFTNGLRVLENLFLGVTCGYGLRLYRIAGVFLLVPLLAGLLFALGGDPFALSADGHQLASLEALATAGGVETLLENVYFSYVTFLTIGYGDVVPVGLGARVTAAGLVYCNVILAGLFLYALIKRSEI